MEDIYIEYLKTGGMFLKVQQSKKQFLIFYMSGFLAGILYANMVSDSYLESYGVFSEYFLRQFQITEIIPEEYLGYLLRIRIIPVGVLLAAGCTRWKQMVVVVTLLWTGLASGIVLTSGILQLGATGIVICAVGVFPQIFFYLPAALVYLWYLYLSPQVRWNSGKSIFTGLMFLAGIALEAYINPVCLKAAIRLFVK